MSNNNLKRIANILNQLACKECTKKWINDHDKSTNPVEDILDCFEKGLISEKLKNRLINEVQEIYNTI